MYSEKNVDRISFTVPSDFLQEFDKLTEELGFKSRSQAISDAMRMFFTKKKQEDPNVEIDGFVIIAYNHHQRKVLEELTELEHHSEIIIKSSMHIHVSEENCSEVIAVQGRAENVKDFANKLQSIKGIMLCELVPLYFSESTASVEHEHHH
ncbi:MAG: nickel-responsive transcriptional regulator NikR [Promethearchaeota archaeon]